MNLFKRKMINLKSLNRKNHKKNKSIFPLINLKLSQARLAELLRQILKKNSNNWCLNSWKKSKNLFLKSLLLAQRTKKLFMKESLVMNAEKIASKESDTNVQFALILTCAKIVRLLQAIVIHSLKSNIPNRLLTKSLPLLKMIMKILLKWMDIEFNYHNSLLWINYLMHLEDHSKIAKEDSILDLNKIIHNVLLKETFKKRKRKKWKRKFSLKSLKRKQRSKSKSLLKRLSLKLKANP